MAFDTIASRKIERSRWKAKESAALYTVTMKPLHEKSGKSTQINTKYDISTMFDPDNNKCQANESSAHFIVITHTSFRIKMVYLLRFISTNNV